MKKTNVNEISIFDLMEDNIAIQEFNDANKVITEEKKVETKKEVKKDTTKVSNMQIQKIDPIKEIEDKCSKFNKIILKVWSQEVKNIEGEDVKNIKLEELKKFLIENSFEEFAAGVTWHLTPSTADKTLGYLIPTYKFQAKG